MATVNRKNDAVKFPTSLNLSNKHVATTCGHQLHPELPERFRPAYCPVCDIIVYLNILHQLAKAWDSIGGPWAHYHVTHGDYLVFRDTWHAIRLNIEDYLAELQEEAEHEARWENEHPLEADAARATLSTAHAISSGPWRKSGKAKKMVSFAKDTNLQKVEQMTCIVAVLLPM
ncbi:predicted protein [Plenodomus lingam JN3]|uniref:Predicted protein n=1 Tax=Leptosphaeria maculans (strain JN3 / isolate v23.1.3 / race Av1-4-5-6-7-8) TaxID=985895 RepID=E5A7W5_LEPMJ|nr:predicted protein [Plenodomus lingam JN3]CBX99710.1 predicted protein [Plenodomus lingam JN3]